MPKPITRWILRAAALTALVQFQMACATAPVKPQAVLLRDHDFYIMDIPSGSPRLLVDHVERQTPRARTVIRGRLLRYWVQSQSQVLRMQAWAASERSEWKKPIEYEYRELDLVNGKSRVLQTGVRSEFPTASPDGRWLAGITETGETGERNRLLRLERGDGSHGIDSKQPGEAYLKSIAWSPDSKFIYLKDGAFLSSDGTLREFEVPSMRSRLIDEGLSDSSLHVGAETVELLTQGKPGERRIYWPATGKREVAAMDTRGNLVWMGRGEWSRYDPYTAPAVALLREGTMPSSSLALLPMLDWVLPIETPRPTPTPLADGTILLTPAGCGVGKPRQDIALRSLHFEGSDWLLIQRYDSRAGYQFEDGDTSGYRLYLYRIGDAAVRPLCEGYDLAALAL